MTTSSSGSCAAVSAQSYALVGKPCSKVSVAPRPLRRVHTSKVRPLKLTGTRSPVAIQSSKVSIRGGGSADQSFTIRTVIFQIPLSQSRISVSAGTGASASATSSAVS